MEEFGLSRYDAGVLTSSRELGDYFEACVAAYPHPKTVANWVMGELARLLNAHNLDITAAPVKPAQLAALLRLVDDGTISGKIAKTVFEDMFATGEDPAAIVRKKGLVQIADEEALGAIVDEVLRTNPKSVQDYRGGKEKALGFLVGQVMKATRGKANPALVNRLLKEKLQ
jgi:aspartyl-tRNA(Asn)/glutamyl-tRNA(Gln) amidotransferase subunit B